MFAAAVGDSVAYILEEMGLQTCGAYGTTACLAMLNDAVKKGGVMASSTVGGLSGAFIPDESHPHLFLDQSHVESHAHPYVQVKEAVPKYHPPWYRCSTDE